MVIAIPLRETDPICRLTTRNNNLFDPQLTRRFDNIVGAQHISLETLIVRHQHVARIGGEMDYRVHGTHGHSFAVAWLRVVVDMEVGGEGIEDLAGVREIGF